MGEQVFYGDGHEEDWYQAMLRDGWTRPGNNARLQHLIERTKAGEPVTLAVIGGSVTEGAGAASYPDCYAARFLDGFAARFQPEGKKNVFLLNAGVGGTASPFGLTRWQRDIVSRVQDPDGLPDLVIIEYSVNDYQEPSKHRCYESLVKTILAQPNDPVVILLFAVFRNGFNLQDELKKIGETYDLMMVSVRDAAYPLVGSRWTEQAFFFDEYHPTSLGHAVMADCLLSAVDAAAARPADDRDIDLNVPPAYGVDFMGFQTVYGDSVPEGVTLERGGFAGDDAASYKNAPVGRVCGKNFHHRETDGNEPLRLTMRFKKLLISWRAVSDPAYGEAEILVDGKVRRTLRGGEGKWGQSETVLIWDAAEASGHTVEIRMAEGSERKRFTVTAICYVD